MVLFRPGILRPKLGRSFRAPEIEYNTQGVALGCLGLPFQGIDPPENPEDRTFYALSGFIFCVICLALEDR